jgi:hypothetical protein
MIMRHPLTSVSEGMITVRLSNKEIVITAVKVVITADPGFLAWKQNIERTAG